MSDSNNHQSDYNPQSDGGSIEHLDQLAGYMESGNKDKVDWCVGTEHEKFGFCKETLQALPYDGERSVRSVLLGLKDRFGWEPLEESGYLIGLTKGGANISLEPGGALELAGKPLKTIHETCDEVNTHLKEVKEIADKIGVYVKRSGGQDLIDELLASDLGQKSKSAKAGLEDMKLFLKYSDLFGCNDVVSFDLSLARGLDYYTGIIYEAVLTDDNTDEKGMI